MQNLRVVAIVRGLCCEQAMPKVHRHRFAASLTLLVLSERATQHLVLPEQRSLLRRARIFQMRTNKWQVLKPLQNWEDGEVLAAFQV